MSEAGTLELSTYSLALFPANPIVGYKLQNMEGVKGVIELEDGKKKGRNRVRGYCVFMKWASK